MMTFNTKRILMGMKMDGVIIVDLKPSYSELLSCHLQEVLVLLFSNMFRGGLFSLIIPNGIFKLRVVMNPPVRSWP